MSEPRDHQVSCQDETVYDGVGNFIYGCWRWFCSCGREGHQFGHPSEDAALRVARHHAKRADRESL